MKKQAKKIRMMKAYNKLLSEGYDYRGALQMLNLWGYGEFLILDGSILTFED